MYLGIDVGSVSTNAVIVDEKGEIAGYAIRPSGYDHKQTVEAVIEQLCKDTGILRERIIRMIGTGYGRRNIPDTCKTVTEITCHAAGVRHLYHNARTIIDIGGQDSKVIWLAPDGTVDHFNMNDKCSAGTGRFLEVMAQVMGMDLEEFSKSGLHSASVYKISSVCTVFAESELISGISKGIPREELIAGIYQAIVERVLALAGPAELNENVVLTGGVAKNMGVAEFMKRRISSLVIPFEPQISGALGAALIAKRNGYIT